MKDGGGGGDEWPWKVMENTNSESDKWITPSNIGWIVYSFAKPIVIRGYGIKTAGDFPERDPKDWDILIEDAVAVNTKETLEKWELVHSVRDKSMPERQ